MGLITVMPNGGGGASTVKVTDGAHTEPVGLLSHAVMATGPGAAVEVIVNGTRIAPLLVTATVTGPQSAGVQVTVTFVPEIQPVPATDVVVPGVPLDGLGALSTGAVTVTVCVATTLAVLDTAAVTLITPGCVLAGIVVVVVYRPFASDVVLCTAGEQVDGEHWTNTVAVVAETAPVTDNTAGVALYATVFGTTAIDDEVGAANGRRALR